MLFHVEIGELKSAANKLKAAVEEYGNATQATKAAADTVAAGWEGDAQTTFVEEQAQAVAWYQAVANAVNVYIAAINAAAALYQLVDQDAVGFIS